MHLPLLHAALFTPMGKGRWGLPLLFEGEPGAAKTTVIEDYAERINRGTASGFSHEVLSPGERGEGAFGVVPVPRAAADERTVMDYPAPAWTDKFHATQRGLIFLDEVTSCSPLVQAPMLGLLTSRRIGGATLPATTRLLGACNPVELAAYGHDLAPPLANRFGWVKWRNPTADEHAAYMMGAAREDEERGIDAAAEEARVMAAWPDAYARAVGLECAFLRAHEDWLAKCPKGGDPKASRAWPSSRTWTYGTRAAAAAAVHRLSDALRDELVAGFIGELAYEAFATWAEHADIPDASAVLDGGERFKHDPKRLDRTAALVTSCTTLVIGTKDRDVQVPRATALWGILQDVGDSAMDLTVEPAKAMIQAKLQTVPGAMRPLARLNPVLELAGVRV